MTNREMLENRRHKIKPCSIDCGEFDPTTLTAFYALIVSIHLTIFYWRQEVLHHLFAKKPEIPAQTAIGGAKSMLTKYTNRRYNSSRFYVPSSVPNPSSICVFCSKE
ncbi:hypothetical protein IE984_06350 [Klebsiella pneumoniae]|nr:hypothetical protein [Klebsiella pneumoniae]